MKKRILLFTLVLGIGYLTFSSYVTGPAALGFNRTGAQGSATTCGGSGCHGTSTATTVSIVVDSSSTPVTRYKPGESYTIKITGTSTTNNNYFGFEFAAVSGSGSSQVQAGSFSGYPSNVGGDALSGLTIVEQHNKLAASSAGNYSTSFTWTAPSTGVGNVTLYCTLNAVNGDGVQDAGDISGNTSITLTPDNTTGIANAMENVSVKAFPNPVSNNLNLQFDNAAAGNYTIRVIDLMGHGVYNQLADLSNQNLVNINTTGWASGIYQVMIEKDGSVKTLSIVK